MVGPREENAEDGRSERDSEIVSQRPVSRSTSFYPTLRGSNVAISLPCYTPPIYVSTTPGRYLQPVNKLIHYSTEQSSSFLYFCSFASLVSASFREPFSLRLFRECCQRFSNAPFTPCCRDDDTPRFTRPSPSTHPTIEESTTSKEYTARNTPNHQTCIISCWYLLAKVFNV